MKLNLTVFIQEITDLKKRMVSLGEYESIGTHWAALNVYNNHLNYFDSFRVEHNPKEIKKFLGNKNTINICRIQAYNSLCLC